MCFMLDAISGRILKINRNGLEATSRTGLDPATLPAVFTSPGGDGENCHEI